MLSNSLPWEEQYLPCFFDTYCNKWNCTGNKVIGIFRNSCRSWPKISGENNRVWFLPEIPWEIRFFLPVPVSHLHLIPFTASIIPLRWAHFNMWAITLCRKLSWESSCKSISMLKAIITLPGSKGIHNIYKQSRNNWRCSSSNWNLKIHFKYKGTVIGTKWLDFTQLLNYFDNLVLKNLYQ